MNNENNDIQKKKIILTIVGGVIILVILGFIIYNFYITKMYNYKDISKTAINNYYVSGEVDDLKSIPELFKKYKKKEEIKQDIQKYNYSLITEWFLFLDNKYICNVENMNSCKIKKNEYNSLIEKVNNLYNYRNIEGYTIISKTDYKNLIDDLNKKIESMNDTIKDPNAKRPLNEVEKKEEKCNSTNNCSECRNGICICTYLDENNARQEITCKKNLPDTK